ncbi:MAG: TIGR03986 family CRISPR-associated RAMP protein [Candidatus Omnitrophica bacterium]|nr:TIGR03986 family CRISPR-associated RAMP protein [Candidatus Omnitrophota bacterium]
MPNGKFINPYNFVRPDKKEVERAKFTPHKKFEGYSGILKCELKTLTPIFIPDPEKTEVNNKNNEHKTMRFFRINDKPAIPSTEIKGMIRSVAEGLSNSCFSQFEDERLPYRASPLTFIDKGKIKAKGGIVSELTGYGGKLQKAEVFIIPKNEVECMKEGREIEVWEVNDNRFKKVTSKDSTKGQSMIGKLKKTSKKAPKYNFDRVFVPINKYIEFDENVPVKEDFEELLKDQMIERKEYTGGRETYELQVGDLVYYEEKNGKVVQIAAVQKPRLKYLRSTGQALESPKLSPCENINSLCPCCRIFGMVSKKEGFAGKVSFGIALAENSPTLGNFKTLQPLGSPKPSCVQFYLIDKCRNNDKVVDYNNDNAIIRGRKFYYHHTPNKENSYTDEKTNLNSTVEICPEETTFVFNVYFYNLSDYELGLLLYSLELENGLAHKIGMAKPLGLGSVKISIKEFILFDRKERYSSILNTGLIENPDKEKFILEYKKKQCNYSSKDKNEIERNFNNLPYIKDFKAILKWPSDFSSKIKYPRARRKGTPYGYQWFMNNKNRTLPLPEEVSSDPLDGWS